MLAAARLGSLQVYLAPSVAAVALLFAWMAVRDTVGFVVFCVLYGLLSGVLMVAPSAAISHPVLLPSMGVIGTRMGMGWMFAGSAHGRSLGRSTPSKFLTSAGS